VLVRILLRNPNREVELEGPLSVREVLRRVGVAPEGVLVIRGDTLLTSDVRLEDADRVEVRPVISGGAA
jgi:sulfur carrier protein